MSASNHPYVVALTGGIASGKTLVSDAFAKLGVPIIDTDVIAREIVEPGQPALKEIENRFGPDIIDTSGQLKRAQLRSLIFSDSDARQALESILHPKIRKEAIKAIAKVSYAYCILVIPLFDKKDGYPDIDRILVVDVNPETQITRLIARDKSSLKHAVQALASQTSRAYRLRIADDVLDNSGPSDVTIKAIARLHQQYRVFAIQQASIGCPT